MALFLGALWLLLALLGGAQLVIPAVPAGVALPQLAPGLAALLMLAVFRADQVRLSFSLGSKPAARVGLAVAVPLTIAAIAAGVVGIVPEWNAHALSSAIIVGVLWVPFHVGLWGLGALRFGLFAVGLVAASIVIFALVRDAVFSLTIATLFHVAINVGSVLLGAAAVSLPVLAVIAGAWVIAAVASVFLRRHLFLDPLPGPELER